MVFKMSNYNIFDDSSGHIFFKLMLSTNLIILKLYYRENFSF
jgi:hypothetical protein